MPERFRNALPDIEESIHLFVDFHRAGLYAVVYGDIDHWIKNSRLLNENQTNRMVDILMHGGISGLSQGKNHGPGIHRQPGPVFFLG